MPSELQQQVNELTAKVKNCVDNGEQFLKSTCNTNSYGWSTTEHTAMSMVAQAFRNEGYGVSSSMNHGVMDWEINPKVTVNI